MFIYYKQCARKTTYQYYIKVLLNGLENTLSFWWTRWIHQFNEGYFIKTKDVITGGEFIIDMNSITNYRYQREKRKRKLSKTFKRVRFF